MEIQDFPNYLIYDDGRVFNKYKNIFMKQTDRKDGYKQVSLSNNIGRKNITIHRLVAIHYIPNPENKKEVDHINRIRDDNNVENLRWVTREENQKNKGFYTSDSRYQWIQERGNSYRFRRYYCKSKSSKNISKLLCYSFFYLLKHPINS